MHLGTRQRLRGALRRAALAGSLRIPRTRGDGRSEGLPQVRVLAYQWPGDAPETAPQATAKWFRQHLAWLAEHERVIPVDALSDHLRGPEAPRDGSVVISVDVPTMDAAVSVGEELVAAGLPGVLFIAADGLVELGGSSRPGSPSDGDPGPFTAAQVEIGSLGPDPRVLASLADEEAVAMIAGARGRLARQCARQIRCHSYSGRGTDVPLAARVAVQAAGYAMAFTSKHGSATRFTDPLLIPRIAIDKADEPADLQSVCDGALDSLGWVDRWAEGPTNTRSRG